MIVAGKPPNYDPRFNRTDPNAKIPACDIWGYNICCEARPYQKRLPGKWVHPTKEFKRTVENWYDGDAEDIYTCLICGERIRVYIPR